MYTGCREGTMALLLALAGGVLAPAAHAGKPVTRPTAQGSFTDQLTAIDGVRWAVADGSAGSPTKPTSSPLGSKR